MEFFNFDSILEECDYVYESIKYKTDYIILTNNDFIKKTLNNLHNDLDFKYEYNLILNLGKLFLNLNLNYQNRELLYLYEISDDFIGKICDTNSCFANLWFKHYKLMHELKISEFVNSNHYEKFNKRNKNLINPKKTCEEKMYCINQDANKKFNLFLDDLNNHILKNKINYTNLNANEYINCLKNILYEFLKNYGIQKIVNINEVMQFSAENLYICDYSSVQNDVNDLLCKLENNYSNIYLCSSNNKCEDLNEKQIKKENQKSIKIQFNKLNLNNIKFDKLNVTALGSLQNNVLSFYLKSILNLKSFDYNTEEFIMGHIKIILSNYLITFNISVIDLYLKNQNLPILDKIKITLKATKLIQKIQAIFVDEKITNKYFNIYVHDKININNNVIKININYDALIVNNNIGILCKTLYFTTLNKKDILLMRNLYVNELMIGAFNVLFEYRLSNIKLCFITMNEIFDISLDEINHENLIFKTKLQISSNICCKHHFSLNDIDMKNSLNRLMYDYLG